jgi:hypothetical protein
MTISCVHCGEYFCPSDECVDLISEGYISSDNVNICDDCWDMLEHLQEMIFQICTVMLIKDYE